MGVIQGAPFGGFLFMGTIISGGLYWSPTILGNNNLGNLDNPKPEPLNP